MPKTMIPVAYKSEQDPYEGAILYLTGYDYYRKFHGWAIGSNKNQPADPYNYYDEINNAMQSLGYCEIMESIYGLNKTPNALHTVKQSMAALGFDLIPVAD